ncbi:hypothetical protein CROQUDRAFT_724204 [Cronartium quercuum f. sp. fusiforme G11]|uniref:Uncharacterized protein n=1 Tax=Cronartium quercuum f. sp. fusiforme G11 TaxID=708437 RepID=A0A9P6T9D4_9BASI|nr:hypothetical protein CROQUDRAFT_724204 [Cronartium quercuum f. sp. fusiforme G11]
MKFLAPLLVVIAIGLFSGPSHTLPGNPAVLPRHIEPQAKTELTQSFDSTYLTLAQAISTIERDCEKGSVPSVLASLTPIHTAVIQLSGLFDLDENLPSPIVERYAYRCGGLLIKVQDVIKIINRFPLIATTCKPLVAQFVLQFQKMLRYIKRSNVNVYPYIKQKGQVDIGLWGSLGLNLELS